MCILLLNFAPGLWEFLWTDFTWEFTMVLPQLEKHACVEPGIDMYLAPLHI